MGKIILLFLVFANFGCVSIHKKTLWDAERPFFSKSSKPIDAARAPLKACRRWSLAIPGQISQTSISRDGRTLLVSSSAEPGGANRARLFELARASRRALWAKKIKQPVKSQALSQDGRFIALSTYDNKLALFDRGGKRLWEENHLGRPVFLDSGAYGGMALALINDDDSQPQSLFFVYSLSGHLLSEVRAENVLSQIPAPSQEMIDVFVGETSHSLYAAFTGNLTARLDERGGVLAFFETQEPVLALTEGADGGIYAATAESLYRFKAAPAKSGQPFPRLERSWKTKLPSHADALGVLQEGERSALLAYANTPEHQWVAGYDTASGASVWSYSYPHGAAVTPPAWNDERAMIVFFDLHEGGSLQSVGLTASGAPQWSSLAPAPNGIYSLAGTRAPRGAAVFVLGQGAPTRGAVDYYSAASANGPCAGGP